MRETPRPDAPVVVGIGAVSPAGVGTRPLWRAVTTGAITTGRVSRHDLAGYPTDHVGEVCAADLDRLDSIVPAHPSLAGRFFAASPNDKPLDVEEEVFVRAVVPDAPDIVEGDGVERGADRPGVRARHDALLREHHEVGVVNPHERREELRLGVLEVLVEDACDVLGIELHGR